MIIIRIIILTQLTIMIITFIKDNNKNNNIKSKELGKRKGGGGD